LIFAIKFIRNDEEIAYNIHRNFTLVPPKIILTV